MKVALLLEYCGTRYSGWQRQHHADSVQAHVERAMSKVADESIAVVCSGRTDAGVHAWQQCAHFETSATRECKAWVMGGNAHLPADISIRSAHRVSDDFHARYRATGRSYRYEILNLPARSALRHKRVAVVHTTLDASVMHRAAQALIGEHDFSSFRAAGCQARHARRELTSIEVSRHGAKVVVQLSGNAFLHNMVRIITGSLIRVGHGLEREQWIAEVLARRDRKCAGVTAVPDGLYFMGPSYPAEFELPDWRETFEHAGSSLF